MLWPPSDEALLLLLDCIDCAKGEYWKSSSLAFCAVCPNKLLGTECVYPCSGKKNTNKTQY